MCGMNIAQLFSPVEKIVGLEIAQGVISAVLLERNKKGVLRMVKKSVAVPAGAMRNGALLDKNLLVATLESFRQNNKDLFKSKYIILVLPPAFVYTDILKFPPLGQEQIDESVKLNLSSKTLFPLGIEEIYYDWQNAASHDHYHREILLSFAPKENIRRYLEACEEAGLEPLAFETPPFALSRALENFKEKTGLVIRLMDEGVELAIIAKNELRFSRFVQMPAVETLDAFKEFVKNEAYKAVNFYAIENAHEEAITSAVIISYFAQKKDVADHLAQQLGISVENAHVVSGGELEDAYAAAYGAAQRGLIRREDDTLISLMPIGTEETYRKRRFLSYVSLWSDIVNTTAVLLIVLFSGMWFFLNATAKKTNAQLTQSNAASAVGAQIAELEKAAAHFNDVVANITTATQTIRPWSSFARAIASTLEYDNITVRAISLPSYGGEITVSATAATRDAAILFRKALEKNELYEDVRMSPLGVLEKENIALTISLTMKPQQP